MSAPLSPSIVAERAKARHEPGWLADARQEAFASYRAVPQQKGRRVELTPAAVEPMALRAAAAPLRPRYFSKASGVVHMPLAEAAREHADLVKPLLSVPVESPDPWARLHRALWSEGSLLFVERSTEVEDPIQVETRHTADGGVVRDLIVLERAAKLSLVTRTTGAGPGALALEGIEAHVRDGANLSLATLQDAHRGATLLTTRSARLHRDARLQWIDGQFGGATTVVTNETRLVGPGSGLRYIGAFFGSKDQRLDATTSALHEGAHTQSQLDMKGALSDDGYSANYSIVNIGPDARNSSGHQHQETLILSDEARADAIPKLDVENNDVSASHGATVGQVDPDQLFYLRTRAFSEPAAKRLIVEGFFEPLLKEIPVESVREEVRTAILARMTG